MQNYKTLPLSQGYEAIVDPEDYERFSSLKWSAQVQRLRGLRVYAYRCVWGEDGKCRTILLHREIMGAQKGQTIDHIDRNTLDCRKRNLRFATQQQNSFNRLMPANKHGFRGIAKNGPGFRGHVVLNSKSHYTRTFPCPILAAAARDVLAQQLHGSFAVLNFQFIPAGGAQ